jgi:serine phosphatase RsbU (regulator of sigma subunit)
MSLAPDTSRDLAVIEWAVCGRPIGDETVSGDLHVVELFAGGALVGVIDGLGHGPGAAHAARVAAAVLGRTPAQPVQDLVQICHEALRDTRGAVLSLASIDTTRDALSWIGVGNVEATLLRAEARGPPVRDHIIPRNGVVGYQLPPLRVATREIAPGDILIFASDGLRHGFAQEPFHGHPLDIHAADLLERYGKTSDDALVLVVRYLGAGDAQ